MHYEPILTTPFLSLFRNGNSFVTTLYIVNISKIGKNSTKIFCGVGGKIAPVVGPLTPPGFPVTW